MATSIADLGVSHVECLNRIPGLLFCATAAPPARPVRDMLASTLHVGDNRALPDRQRENLLLMIQCLDWFAEFFPAGHESEAREGSNDLWSLIRDELPLKSNRTTHGGLQKLWELVHDARTCYKRMQPNRPDLVDTSAQEKFFLKCLDAHMDHRRLGISRAQLQYGARHDHDFAVRLTSRIRQWRILKRTPQRLLIAVPPFPVDVCPTKEWNVKFMEMAEGFAIDFNKPVPQIPDGNAHLVPVASSRGNPELAMLRQVSLQQARMAVHIKDMEDEITALRGDVQHVAKVVKNHLGSCAATEPRGMGGGKGNKKGNGYY